jgi:hypothetical protein
MISTIRKAGSWRRIMGNQELLNKRSTGRRSVSIAYGGRTFALGLSSTHALPLFCHAPQSPLELAEPVFRSLRGCTLHDRTAHQCFLQRDALQDFAGIEIKEEWVMRAGHGWLLTPVVRRGIAYDLS